MNAPNLQQWYDARDSIVEYVKSSLAGPGVERVLSQPPLNEIIVGILHPAPQIDVPEFGENSYAPLIDLPYEPIGKGAAQNENMGSEYAADSSIMGANTIRPSSMGLTFAVSPSQGTKKISIHAQAISYLETDKGWAPTLVKLDAPWILDVKDAGTSEPRTVAPGLELRAIVRPINRGRIRITVTLLNTQKVSPMARKDEYCWFQPEIRVSSIGGFFVESRPDQEFVSSDPDTKATNFLYRSSRNLAIGHGCAAWWSDTEVECDEIRTTFFPRQEVALANPSGGMADDPHGAYDLSMRKVGTAEGRMELHRLANAYETWINKQRNWLADSSSELSTEHKTQAELNIDNAENCLARIRHGIEVLDSDAQVSEAFRLMNIAMVNQRLGLNGEGQPSWRPFQLAFILLNLAGLSGSRPSDRDIADLLWFPTGGGKTEAYLGCIAFSILLRRIRNPRDGGISAIMRYTLRLLTTDQFKRAAALVCGLEVVRRLELPESTPISLGLWVGGGVTPNTVKEANDTLQKLSANIQPDEGSTPVQLLKCPWCRQSLDFQDYRIQNHELNVSCPNVRCDFHDHLPFHVVDEDIYRVRPSLIIGTVDKFAQMTWREKVSELFSMDGRYSTPDLIVQDELHLITGPLGTMVGLYESALDIAITSQGGVPPKILASTATIRRADSQVRAVFDRKAAQFPPPGVDASDNYFSRDADRSSKGTREYVGIFAPGQSQTTQLVWLYSAILQAVEALNAPNEVKDTYWTLLAYFNSLRVLGSAYIQTIDDVPKRVAAIADRNEEKSRDLSHLEPLELTSRVASTKIPEIREKMELKYPDEASPNVVLATNMISVGLDIDRLGLMVVAGQPQDSSEYIQATSRVGRQKPGLVFVAFNSSKTRDVSHFESFIPFHRSLYRAVEATTVTPFSSRARDRGAHGALVAAARMLVEEARGDRSAGNIEDFAPLLRMQVIPRLVDRAARIAPEEAQAFNKQLNSLLDSWIAEAEDGRIRLYGEMHPKQAAKFLNESLLAPASAEAGAASFGGDRFGIPWQTLTSLRNVDAETQFSMYLTRRED